MKHAQIQLFSTLQRDTNRVETNPSVYTAMQLHINPGSVTKTFRQKPKNRESNLSVFVSIVWGQATQLSSVRVNSHAELAISNTIPLFVTKKV